MSDSISDLVVDNCDCFELPFVSIKGWFVALGSVVLEDVVCVVGGYGDSSLGSLLVFVI